MQAPQLTCVLWQIAAGALGTDILRVVEAQPALLLQEASPLDDEVRAHHVGA